MRNNQSVMLEVSALPQDGRKFDITYKDDFGTETFGPCKINKKGELVFVDLKDGGKETKVQRLHGIAGYTIRPITENEFRGF